MSIPLPPSCEVNILVSDDSISSTLYKNNGLYGSNLFLLVYNTRNKATKAVYLSQFNKLGYKIYMVRFKGINFVLTRQLDSLKRNAV